LKSEKGQAVEITVCGRHCDIFRNHASVNRVLNAVPCGYDRFDIHYRLSEDTFEDEQLIDPVDRYARELGVVLTNKHPQISLESYDFFQVLRFKISKLSHPRIVIAPGSSCGTKMWEVDKWMQLCDVLEDKIDASLIQLGEQGESFFGFGLDLIGKVSAREAATIISRCDLLVSIDNGYAHLAAAVETPRVVLFGQDYPVEMSSGASLAVVAEGRSERENSVGFMEGISLASVINGIVNVCGKDQR
jgi:ADP-heptose:LPS heptosyltransferase